VADEDIKQGEFVIEYVGEGDAPVAACYSIEIAYLTS
jgi:hypothetical protein